jgi:trk system potassium uptake protein TrkA
MNYVVVGCGNIGSELAHNLFLKGHTVSVIDRSPSAFSNLPIDFKGRTVEGEGLEKEVLHRAGIEHADGLVAVTSSDAVNAVVAHVAQVVYDIENVAVRNYDPSRRPVLEAFGLQLVDSSSWGAQRLEEILYHANMHTVFSAGNGEVEVYEFTVPAAGEGRPLEDFLPAENCVPVSVTRAGRASLPTMDTVVREGDVVNLSATLEGIRAVCQKLNEVQEGTTCLF